MLAKKGYLDKTSNFIQSKFWPNIKKSISFQEMWFKNREFGARSQFLQKNRIPFHMAHCCFDFIFWNSILV